MKNIPPKKETDSWSTLIKNMEKLGWKRDSKDILVFSKEVPPNILKQIKEDAKYERERR